MQSALHQSTFILTGAQKSKEVVKYPEGVLKTANFQQKVNNVSTEYVEATFKEYLFDGVKIEMRDIKLEKELRIDVNHNFPFFKMHFEIEGVSNYTPNNNKSLPVTISNGHHQLFFFPAVQGVLTYPAKTRKSTLEINLSLSFLYKVFKDNWGVLEKLGEAIQKNKPFVFSSISHKINSEIQLVIQQIKNCKISDDYKKTYLESKVIELLILQLQDFKDDFKTYELISHNKQIIDAKLFIEANINKPLTINLIAKVVGMNTQDFKKEFKIKFGQTVFKFITSKRMELAIEMLKSTDKSISEIANAVGYKYSQHFAKAFKKYYGNNPSFCRQ